MCTVLLPPGVNPIAVNKYIISCTLHKNAKVDPEVLNPSTYVHSLIYLARISGLLLLATLPLGTVKTVYPKLYYPEISVKWQINKRKVHPQQATNAQRGSRGMAIPFLSSPHQYGVGLDGCGKFHPHRDSIPGLSSQ
jgi:hypothetical protein